MPSSNLQTELNETLRKIGRNVLYFQRMEHMLKFLLAHSSLEGTKSTLKENHEKARDAVSHQTMGNLVKGLFTSVYKEEDHGLDGEPGETTEPTFSMSFTIEADESTIQMQKAALEQIVEERNNLIHQQLSKFDQTSLHSCRRLGTLLDEQVERIKPQYETLRSQVITLIDGKKIAVEALSGSFERST